MSCPVTEDLESEFRPTGPCEPTKREKCIRNRALDTTHDTTPVRNVDLTRSWESSIDHLNHKETSEFYNLESRYRNKPISDITIN